MLNQQNAQTSSNCGCATGKACTCTNCTCSNCQCKNEKSGNCSTADK